MVAGINTPVRLCGLSGLRSKPGWWHEMNTRQMEYLFPVFRK
jgi:hypothetical protein